MCLAPILCTFMNQGFIGPGRLRGTLIGGGGVFAALADAGRWVRRLLGRPGAALVPLPRAQVWRIDETPQRADGEDGTPGRAGPNRGP